MKTQPRHVAVLVTVPDKRVARALAAAALDARQCACAQIVPGLESHYRWKGRLEKSRELLVVFKTRGPLVKALERTVARLHPYEVPQFVVVPIVGGSKAYLAWIDAETTPAPVSTKPIGRIDASGERTILTPRGTKAGQSVMKVNGKALVGSRRAVN